MTNPPDPRRPDPDEDFSPILGGPLYQLMLRTRMLQPPMDLLRRRVIAITAVAWLPAALLALFEGRFLPGSTAVPFLYDIEAHVKLLVALPMFVIAEAVVHQRLSPAMRAFHERGIVREADLPRFHAAIDRARRLRNSIPAEVLLIATATTAGFVAWREGAALSRSWYLDAEGAQATMTTAGAWYALVSLSLMRFLLLRWYFRLFVWGRLLRDLSRLDLRIVATHPDRAGGLGFIGDATYAFGPVLFGQGALFAAIVASAVLHEGRDPFVYKIDLACLVGVLVVLVALPCCFFGPAMMRAKRLAGREYGLLASRYVMSFEDKWIAKQGEPAPGAAEPLLGSADLQSLADLGNGTAVIREMRSTPLDFRDLIRLAMPVVAPALPLVLTKIPIEEILRRAMQVVL